MEFALIVSDRYQHQGIGTELVRRLIEVGKEENLEAIVGYVLTSNNKMRNICRQLGFQLHPDPETGMLKVIYPLTQ